MTPADIDAERAVLGALLIDNAAYHAVGTLTSGQFFRHAHQVIYTALVHLLDRGDSVDLVSLRAALAARGVLEDVGGPAYLASLVDGVPRAMNVGHYAAIVMRRAYQRRLIQLGREVISRTEELSDDDPAAVVEWWERQMTALRSPTAAEDLETASAAIPGVLARLTERIERRGQVTGIPTGFASIDQLTLGWQRGDLVFIGARPSMGKSALGLTSALAAAQAGHRAVVFSMEMSRAQLWDRLISGLSGVGLERILAGYTTEHEVRTQIAPAAERLHDLPLEIDDQPARTATDIRRSCRRIQSERGLGCVVVDYVQLMRGSGERRGVTRNEELTDISSRLKDVARECAVPVLALAQLGRAAEREDRRPRLSDFRDCGAFEQDADVALLLHRKNYREGGVTEAIFAKMRNHKPGTLPITFEADCVRFVDGGDLVADPVPRIAGARARAFRW